MKKRVENNKAVSLYTGYFLFFSSLVLYDFIFRYVYSFVSDFPVFDLRTCLFTLSWAGIFTAIAVILPRLLSKIFVVLISTATAVFGLTNAIFYKIFGNFFSFSSILYAGDGAKFFDISYLNVRKIIWAESILIILSAVAVCILLGKNKYKFHRIAVAVVLFIAALTCLYFVNGTYAYTEEGKSVSWSMSLDEESVDEDTLIRKAYYEFTDSESMFPRTGLYHYTARNIYVVLRELYDRDEENAAAEINAYHDKYEKEKNAENEMTGAFKGKNLIMIMAESLDCWMIDEEYTPNLYRLYNDSITFENNYTPLWLYAGTFSTEFVSLTGIVMPEVLKTNDIYVENDFPLSLPSLFKNEGYSANSFHASSPTIYNRGNIHKNLGFTKYNSYVDMGMDDYRYDSQIINAYDKIVSDEPFYSFIITISGHGPYTEADSYNDVALSHLDEAKKIVEKRNIKGSEKNLEEYTRAVAQIMETDIFIGELTTRLEKDGLLEDTVIVIYGDHYSKYISDRNFLMDYKNVSCTDMLCHTPFFIYSADTKPQKVTKCTSSVDIFPTLVNMFGLDCDLGYFIGDDAFGEGGGYAFWRDCSYFDGEYHENDYGKISSEITERLKISENTLKYDFFGKQTEE